MADTEESKPVEAEPQQEEGATQQQAAEGEATTEAPAQEESTSEQQQQGEEAEEKQPETAEQQSTEEPKTEQAVEEGEKDTTAGKEEEQAQEGEVAADGEVKTEEKQEEAEVKEEEKKEGAEAPKEEASAGEQQEEKEEAQEDEQKEETQDEVKEEQSEVVQENGTSQEQEAEVEAEGEAKPTTQFTEEEKQHCQMLFNKKAVNGQLDLKGFKVLFRLMGQVLSSEDADVMFKDGSSDESRTIDFEEYCRLYCKFSQAEQERKETVACSIEKLFPTTDDQPVELKKVEGLLMKLQQPDLSMRLVREKSDLGQDDVRRLVKAMDRQGTGLISKNEFVETLCSHLQM